MKIELLPYVQCYEGNYNGVMVANMSDFKRVVIMI